MLNIACVQVGNYCGRGADYVNRLYDSVRRNLAEGTEARFVCFTDDPSDLLPDIETRALPIGLKGWWNKVYLFSEEAFPAGDRVLYFDLDTICMGPLDDIIKYQGDFAILRDFYRSWGLGSGVMAWEAGKYAHIWEQWLEEGKPDIDGGDQAWIEKLGIKVDRFQDIFPNRFVSYKVHARDGVPRGASVVCFHGHPRPHEAGGWVERAWKQGGIQSAELLIEANVSRETVAANIRHAMSLDAHGIIMGEPQDRAAVIIAGGPSLKDELNSLRAHQAHSDVFATNNTLRFVREHGIHADFHVMLDSRPENAAFINSEFDGINLYASQCHPDVLNKAKRLKVWHAAGPDISELVQDEVPIIGGGTTVGLRTICLAIALGYRDIHLYGFDSCYRDDAHHAYDQTLNNGERIIETEIEGQTFKCAPWMVTQADDFVLLMPELMALGAKIYIHGTGLIPHLASLMAAGSEKHASDIRADELAMRMGDEPLSGVELGIFTGDLSVRLLTRKPNLKLYMVDKWSCEGTQEWKDSGDYHATLVHQDWAEDLARKRTSFFGERAQIIKGDTAEAAKIVPEVDFAFIDADHSYEGCKRDIEAWAPKVRKFLSGHDYANDAWKFGPMVKRAVDEFVTREGWRLELGDNFTWFAYRSEHVSG